MIISGVKLPDCVQRELIRGENASAIMSIAAQRRLKEAINREGPVREVKGLGRKIATIHPDLAARLRVRDTAAVGRDPFCDPDYMRLLLKHNPFMRVDTEPAKLTIRVDGFRDGIEEPRPATAATGGKAQTAGATACHAAPGDPARPNAARVSGSFSDARADGHGERTTRCSGHETASGRSGRPESTMWEGPQCPDRRRTEAAPTL